MMRQVFGLVLASLLTITTAVHGQQPTAKSTLIGVIGSGAAADPRNQTGLTALRDALQSLGYVEGKNLAFEQRFAERKLDRLAGLAGELVRLKADILLTIDTGAARAAKAATTAIPIVILTGGDPVRNKLIASLARPGGNVTGITSDSPRLAEKRLGLLKEAFPKLKRIAYLSTFPATGGSRAALTDAQPAAKAMGVTFQAAEIKQQEQVDLDGLFQQLVRERIDGVVTEGAPIVSANRKKILQLIDKHRLPAIHVGEVWANDGGLMAYGANRTEPYRRAAVFIDKILKGTKPADIPVEQPTKFEFVINLKTAKQIGVDIPQSVLFRATRVIR